MEQALQHRHAGRSASLEKRALRLDHRGNRSNEIKHSATELFICGRNAFHTIRPMPLTYGERQRFPARIEPDTQRVSLGPDRFGKTIGEMHEVLPKINTSQ